MGFSAQLEHHRPWYTLTATDTTLSIYKHRFLLSPLQQTDLPFHIQQTFRGYIQIRQLLLGKFRIDDFLDAAFPDAADHIHRHILQTEFAVQYGGCGKNRTFIRQNGLNDFSDMDR